MYKFVKFMTNILCRLWYRVKIEGEVNIPDDEGYLICANHIHMFDPVFIMVNHKRQISFMAKKELIETPILGQILLKCGAVSVDRGKGDIAAVKASIETLKEDKVMSIFPEGTRHRDGICRDLKKGAAMVAIKAKSKIVPMRIIGNYKLFSKMILRIGTPIDSEGKNKDELTDELYQAIEALK